MDSSKLRRHAHIQDFSANSTYESHWGYSSRQVPCVQDEGTCAYLDSVYHGHDVSMLYSFILWAVIVGILFLWALARRLFPLSRTTYTKLAESEEPQAPQNPVYRLNRSIRSISRRYLLPESFTSLFGHTTRLHLLVFAIISVYLTIFTFVGLVYKTWVTPVKGSPGVYSTRSSLGAWSDRIGVMAFALTPLSVFLSSRESLLSLITGIPYHHFMFMHRWLGYIIYVQSALHTIMWTVIEGKLYQPQPTQWNSFINQEYLIWGIVAMILLTFLVVFSTQWGIRLTGYEFFRKAHYVVAMVYIGACWGHWEQLSCWMIASLAVWLIDRTIRLGRTFAIHHFNTPGTNMACGFHVPRAKLSLFSNDADGDVVRLDFEHNHDEWEVGQHFFLCFPELSVWQAHPLTPCSVPGQSPTGQQHSYIIRSRNGMTKKLAELTVQSDTPSTSVVLSGPYGQSIMCSNTEGNESNVLCIAGGTGVSFVLPALMQTISEVGEHQLVEFVWVVRRENDTRWIENELRQLEKTASSMSNFNIRIFVTREGEATSESSSADGSLDETEKPAGISSVSTDKRQSLRIQHMPSSTNSASRHPDIGAYLKDFVARTAHGPTCVLASGPLGMITDLRTAVADCNDPAKVWRGDERFDVELVHDDRLEW
ncbi:hypothetical protein AWENTII_009031 [Aspergillus wentii]|nr:hypothetical protein MW887_000785 [Aspergillus wentii]